MRQITVETWVATFIAGPLSAVIAPLGVPTARCSAPTGSGGGPVGIEPQVRDSQNRILETDTVGRVHIRGDRVIDGYPGETQRDRLLNREQVAVA